MTSLCCALPGPLFSYSYSQLCLFRHTIKASRYVLFAFLYFATQKLKYFFHKYSVHFYGVIAYKILFSV